MLNTIKEVFKTKKKLIIQDYDQLTIEKINEKSIVGVSKTYSNEDESLKQKINKIFADIENVEIDDLFIRDEIEKLLREDFKNLDRLRNASHEEKRECLLKEDLKNFTRLNGSKYKDENYSLLHWAARYQRPDLCAYLIDKLKIDVNILTKNKSTPLHLLVDLFDTEAFTVLDKFIKTFQVFLQRKMDINLQTENKSTLLHSSIRKPNYTAVSLLIKEKNLNMSLEDDNGMTPLQLACKSGNEEITKLIIDKIIEQNKHDQFHNKSLKISPIYLTVSNRYEKYQTFHLIYYKLKELNLLENVLNEYDDDKKALLEKSFENGHLQIIDLILKDYQFKKQFDINGNLIIHTAAKYGNNDLFNILLKHDCVSFESNKSNCENSLHIASSYNRYDFVKSLLDYEKKSLKNPTVNSLKPMVQGKTKQNYTPLQLAIIKRYERCVKELIESNEIELDVVENESNHSIYHLCILHWDIESLNILLNKQDRKFNEPLFIKSKQNETPLHMACRMGQMESIKLIINKLMNESIQLVEPYMREQNLDGRTCFHLACLHGHYNIIEYFLKQLKLVFFLEINDNDFNTCLLLAAQNGHERIVELLLDSDANLKAKNSENSTVLEISCRKGYFEMSKIIIDRLDSVNEDISFFNGKKNLIHLAAQEGAHDIVKLLLKRGTQIDSLDENNQTCLDIAIEREHIDVIKVLLNDSNWLKLFHLDQPEQSKQFEKLIDKKMWDMIQIILNKCQIKNINHTDKQYDFRLLDPNEFNDLNKHPLMMLTNSGQEQLLTHNTIRTLLDLKWHKIPRLAYLINITIHLMYLVLFTLYSLDLIEIKRLPENTNAIENDNNLDSVYNEYLITVMSLIVLIMLVKLVLVGPINYLLRIESWIGIITIVLSFLSVSSDNISLKITFCSISIIFIYLQFAFLIQKLKFFGLYVLAFKGTIKNSAKFFPIFMLIYGGFVISFRVRTGTSDIQYFNDTTESVFIKGLTLMLGNFNDDQMGLKSSLINLILYALFIVFLSIIILNLFVGIAVGEITQLLAIASVQQISLRIIFVLQIQYSIRFLNKNKLMRSFFKMTYGHYDYVKDENRFVKFLDNLWIKIKRNLTKANPKINLVDSLTRLDEKLDLLMIYFEIEQLKLKTSLTNQMNYIQSKMNLSQLRLEDNFKDASRRTFNSMESFKHLSSSSSTSLDKRCLNSDLSIDKKLDSFNSLFNNLIQLFDYNQFQHNVRLVNYLNSINERTSENTIHLNMIKEKFIDLQAHLSNLNVKLDKLDQQNQFCMYNLNLLSTKSNE